MSKKILVTGAAGQIGSELTVELRHKYGKENVFGLGNKTKPEGELADGPFVFADTRKIDDLKEIIKKYKINEVHHLASLLSATGEKDPKLAWDININSLKNVLDLAAELKLKVFWPSSIAAFGPTTPRKNTPQHTVMEPTTMYGVTKYAGELLCQYYFLRYGVDVRSVRFPGLISYKTEPGGGTTDYAVAIFYEALKSRKYSCFVRKDTVLPMMYMDDAIKSIMGLMDAPEDKIKIRTSYNLAAISFSAEELAKEVKKHIPGFTCEYKPDERQKIADSWPQSIDDSAARKDWGWKHSYDLKKMAAVMLGNLRKKFGIKEK